MKDILRRGDPTFYDKEPILLRTGVQIPRYAEEAQLEARLKVLGEDKLLHRITELTALAAFVTVSGAGFLGVRGDWPGFAAFVLLLLAGSRALPWWPNPQRPRMLVAVAVAVLFGRALIVVPALTLLAGALAVFSGVMIARDWRRSSGVVPLAGFATLLLSCAYAFAFDWRTLALHVPVEIATIAVAFLGVCIIAARVRRADVLARPEGLLSLPQSIVPLLDRSHHHAIICYRV